jgi:hypothetical protein
MEEIAVGHGDEEVKFGGIIVEDPGFGQPNAVGDHLQADSLVILRHKELQGILQNLFPIGFHDLNIFSFQRYNHYSGKCHVLPLNVVSFYNAGGFLWPQCSSFYFMKFYDTVVRFAIFPSFLLSP